LALAAQGAAITFTASGLSAGDANLQNQVSAFRAQLGGGAPNPNEPTNFGTGRREINWDAVPEGPPPTPDVSSPNDFPGGFFNGNASPRARGIVFSTPGTGFQVSRNSGLGFEFNNLNATYPDLFDPFSPNKLFTPVGSVSTDVDFRLPGDQTTPAGVSGFGVIFAGVGRSDSAGFELFSGNTSLGFFSAPALGGNGTFSFLGVAFDDGTQITRVRITSGNTAAPGSQLLPDNDVVVMDDFIYGEPNVVASAVPEPASTALIGAGLLALAVRRRLLSRGR